MNTLQKHVRTIVDFEGRECIEKLTFHFSIIPKNVEELLRIVTQEFLLVRSKDVTFEKRASGSLDVIPPKPQPRPESIKKKLYTIKIDKQKRVATIIVSRRGRNVSLFSEIQNLSEFQTVNILYAPPLFFDL